MTEKNPLVSLIIPVYNSASTINECIARVVKQTYQNWEIVIVDSNSSDGTHEIAAKWRKKLGRERFNYCNIRIRSRTKARNFGVTVSKGNRILLLDSDNFLPKDFLNECVRETGHDDFDGLRPCVREFWKHRSYLAKCWYYLIHGEENGEFREIPYPNFFKRDIWLKLGGQNEKLEIGEDLEFTIRFERAGYSAPLLKRPIVMHNMPFSLKSVLFKTFFSKYPKKIFHKPLTASSREERSIWASRILFMLRNPKYVLGMTFLTLICTIGIIVFKIGY